jgi:NAD(P)-dependent dehydrogenase (short-subunit alcohol dehydrogenase family)
MTKAILVTGASTGIGWAITKSLSEAGALVYVTARNRKDFDSLNGLTNVHPFIMDVTKPNQVNRALREIRSTRRGLYGLVNNAGVVDFWPLAELEDADLRHIFEVNLFGVQRVTRAAIPLLVKSKGRIVNVSSIQGFVSTRFSGPYEMTKHALEAYSDTLAKELKNYGVEVITIEPGGFRTNYARTTARALARRARNYSPILMKREIKKILRKWGDIVAEVSARPAPHNVAVSVRDALFSKRPKHRYVVTTRKEEFVWVLNGLVSKLIEVNRASEYGLQKHEMHRLIDEQWIRES